MLSSLRPGDILQHKYRLERVLGQGGMAIVVSAWHLHLEQRVAIKLLRPETVQHPEVIPRFLREARAASKIESSAVARVIDVDTLPDGTPFIVMEHLEGRDLSFVSRERSPLPAADAANYVRQACAALIEAHSIGIIHRDIKPANLFLAKKRQGGEQIKVLDFGISKLLEETVMTQTSTAMGSAEYMSPEQMQSSRDVDARSDIWSLGVTLYELCTGQSPFHADSVAAVCVGVMSNQPTPPRAIRPEIPVVLEAVILRCLEKDPARRFASAEDLAAALLPFAGPSVALPPARGSQASVPEAAKPAAPLAPASPAKPASPSKGPPWKGPPWLLIGGALGGALIVVAIFAALFHARRALIPAAAASASASDPGGRYRLDAEVLVDAKTGLTWQRKPAKGAMDWAAAKAHCEKAGGGYRLPQVQELSGLLEYTSRDPPPDAADFPATPVDVFWSSSPASGVGNAWVVHFYNGRVAPVAVSLPNRVRCVR